MRFVRIIDVSQSLIMMRMRGDVSRGWRAARSRNPGIANQRLREAELEA